MKDSIIIFTENKDIIDELTDEQAGVLFKAIMSYQASGEVPEISDAVARVVFLSIKKQIDRCNENYEERKRKRSEAGKKGMEKRWSANNNDTTTDNTNITTDNTDITTDNNVITSENKPLQEHNKNNLQVQVQEKVQEKEKKKVKHKYGEYHHVLLTDEEYSRLCSEFGNITIERAIKVVDEYCQTSGKRYKDYNLVIRNWGVERAQNGDSRGSTYLDAIKNRVSVVDSWL